MSAPHVPTASSFPVLPPIYQYHLPPLPQGKVKVTENALQGSATPTPVKVSTYDITV